MSGVQIDEDVAVAMRDGTVLRADVYRPDTAPVPAVLMRTPYSRQQLPALATVLEPTRAARNGFAVVVQDTRGRYGSEGTFDPFDERDDGHDTIAWLAAQPWCDGRVGMFGSSYMAATQLQAAIDAPDALKAIAPFEASANYGEGRSYRGGAFELGALVTIALWALARGTLQRQPGSFRDGMAEVRRALDDLEEFLSVRPLSRLSETILGRAAPYFFDWATSA